jgi:hypothetical protein
VQVLQNTATNSSAFGVPQIEVRRNGQRSTAGEHGTVPLLLLLVVLVVLASSPN